ncbi:VQ motif-containing protein 22-like [Zingiber officinale]|uniref:VQ motif-containing protein 22-like n=1 Tax=Zingiber officinale TaxID=94328 RepID=UPI001C4B1A75|nr:VQ motif-containing protein 22-like [Zingiber officinale]
MDAASEASSSPAQWVPFGGGNEALPPSFDAATESTAVAVASSGGKVARPARRRTRVSRKAPVTLLNTDTANFRAMVQQFTGFPSGQQYGPSAHDAPPAAVMPPPTLHFPQPQLFLEQPQLQFPRFHHHQQQQFPKANEAFFQPNNSDPTTSSEMAELFLFGPGPAQPNIDSGNFRWH